MYFEQYQAFVFALLEEPLLAYLSMAHCLATYVINNVTS
jgi:hypothetical protein